MDSVSAPQLIQALDYDDLRRLGVLPDFETLTPRVETKKYPKFIYSAEKDNPDIFTDFTTAIQALVRSEISGQNKPFSELWTGSSVLPKEFHEESKYLFDISKWVQSNLSFKGVKVDSCLAYQNLVANPDLLSDEFIMDIKCISSFKPVKEKIWMQICVYSALARQNGMTGNVLGLALPMQKKILWYNMANWDSSAFLKVLLQEAQWVLGDSQVVSQQFFSSSIGSHLALQFVMSTEFSRFSAPCQIFLQGPQNRRRVSQASLESLRNNLPKINFPTFVHGRYLYNLCSDEEWVVESLKEELQDAAYIGARGVVVHVGKSTGQPLGRALSRMEKNIRSVLEVATESCPLILETCAKQGTELLGNLEEFSAFCSLFSSRPNFKICVDTCHCFAAGYDPLFFLSSVEARFPGSVVLVHFNDSLEKRGRCVDRHQTPGIGFVGFERMKAIHKFCTEKSIPMVGEYH